MTTKVIIAFSQMRDDELNTRAHNIIEKMTGNPNFPTPVPALADLTTALTAYRQALEQAQYGGVDKTTIKRTKRTELERLFGALGMYVELNCQNDLGILLSSGFDARKSPSAPIAVLERPANFTLENGPYSGSFKLKVDRIPGAGSYIFEHAAMPVTEATQWMRHTVKTRTYTIEGLTSGQQYAFRVSGVGRNATPVYSDVISRYAQ